MEMGLHEPLTVLPQLAGNPEKAVAACGRMSVDIGGYNADPQELFEIPRVRGYILQMNVLWPYWMFFLSQADDSIKVIESSLCDSNEGVPGVTSIDTEQLNHCLTRYFLALNRYCESLNLPETRIEEISEGVISLIHNASVEGIDDDEYQ